MKNNTYQTNPQNNRIHDPNRWYQTLNFANNSLELGSIWVALKGSLVGIAITLL